MMTQDEELRHLYQDTSSVRLQKLQMGLLQLEQDPNDQAALADISQELDGLRADANSLGLETIGTVANELETIVKGLAQQQVTFTLDVSNCLGEGIYAIEQLIYETITGDDASDSDGTQILDSLKATIATVMTPALVTTAAATAELAPDGLVTGELALVDLAPVDLAPAAPVEFGEFYIDDDELREIYRTTSEDRLQALTQGLYQLEQGFTDPDTLELLRRETHSLKGDSRAVELDAVAALIQPMEDVIKDVQNRSIPITEEVSRYLHTGLDTVSQLVHAATSGEPLNVDLTQALEQVTSQTLRLRSGSPVTFETTAIDQPEQTAEGLLDAVSTDAETAPGMIEDAELREIYWVTSTERLQRLEANLLHLEQHASDDATLATVLRELHSLKGDARSAGVDMVESLAHALEDVLSSIQLQQLEFDATISDRLYAGLDAIGTFVQAAVAGTPTDIDTEQLLDDLRATVPSVAEDVAPVAQLPVPDESLPAEASQEKAPQTDTIRIQTRDLDALTAQTEELAVTRIQISQTLSQAEQLLILWEEWKENRNNPQSVSAPSYEENLENLLLNLKSTVESNSSKLELISEDLREQVRRLQLLPISNLLLPLRRTVRDLTKQQSKDVTLIFEGEDATAEKRLLEGIKDSLLHLVRNAIDHGIETPEERIAVGKPATATLRVTVYQTAVSLTIEISDDGRGLDIEKIKQTAIKRKLHSSDELEAMTVSQIHSLVLAPGFSTRGLITEISGRGVGLDVVRTQVEKLKGAIQIESTHGQGSTFRLQLSTALSTANVVLAESQGMTFAIPIEFLETTLLISPHQVIADAGQEIIVVGDQTIPVANLINTLELPNSPIYSWIAPPDSHNSGPRPCIVLKVGNNQAGFFVDHLRNNQEIVVKPMGSLLKRVRNVGGTSILGTGEICTILNPSDLLKSVQQQQPAIALPTSKSVPQYRPTILLVEDSPPVRIQEKRLFEGAGYTVVTATNGQEGYDILQTGEFDAVVSDVEMPYLDGFSLVRKIRQQQAYDQLPIILVTTLDSTADRQRGADAGADAYILKGRFNQEVLLETLERLI